MPILSNVLSTGGDLVFAGDMEGFVHAYDAQSGEELWKFNTGSGMRGGLISYAANGKQYITVASGFGSLVIGFFAHVYPEVTDYPAGAALITFELPQE